MKTFLCPCQSKVRQMFSGVSVLGFVELIRDKISTFFTKHEWSMFSSQHQIDSCPVFLSNGYSWAFTYVMLMVLTPYTAKKLVVGIKFLQLVSFSMVLSVFRLHPSKAVGHIVQTAHTTKVIHPKYSKHWLSTAAHTIDCVCSNLLNHGVLFLLIKFLGWFKLAWKFGIKI